MSPRSLILRNLARGNGNFHFHRREVLRDILESQGAPHEALSSFLAKKFFGLPAGWLVFEFDQKDWRICERLLATQHSSIEARLLELVLAYAAANEAAVTSLYGISATMSERVLRRDLVDGELEGEQSKALEAQSLFGLRLKCASNTSSTETMIDSLERGLSTRGWARMRLVHPMVYHFLNTPVAASLDNFLAYVVTGREHDAEKLALKLMLSDEAARGTSLAFKCFIGLMGHPYDAVEFVLDHVEHELASGRPLSTHLAEFISAIAEHQPRSRAAMIVAMTRDPVEFIEGTRADGLAAWFGLSKEELEGYATLCDLDLVPAAFDDGSKRPYAILANMRLRPYPEPSQFNFIVVNRATWHFIDAGRFIGSLLRSIYMVEREARDLEARDAFRLMGYLGFVNPFLASAPSAMDMLRRLHAHGASLPQPHDIERKTGAELAKRSEPRRVCRRLIGLNPTRRSAMPQAGRSMRPRLRLAGCFRWARAGGGC